MQIAMAIILEGKYLYTYILVVLKIPSSPKYIHRERLSFHVHTAVKFEVRLYTIKSYSQLNADSRVDSTQFYDFATSSINANINRNTITLETLETRIYSSKMLFGVFNVCPIFILLRAAYMSRLQMVHREKALLRM
jgi:hypothetical protein